MSQPVFQFGRALFGSVLGPGEDYLYHSLSNTGSTSVHLVARRAENGCPLRHDSVCTVACLWVTLHTRVSNRQHLRASTLKVISQRRDHQGTIVCAFVQPRIEEQRGCPLSSMREARRSFSRISHLCLGVLSCLSHISSLSIMQDHACIQQEQKTRTNRQGPMFPPISSDMVHSASVY